MHQKLKTLSQLRRLSRRLTRAGKTIVFTNGCFDLLHAGHVTYLQKAKAAGDCLIVGLNGDRSVRKIKGPSRPIQTERDRATVLTALTAVDFVTIFNEPTPLRAIQTIQPRVLVKGADWPMHRIVGAQEIRSWGGRVKRIRLVRGRSTTAILKKIMALG